MSGHHPHERPERERPLLPVRRTPARRVPDAYDLAAAAPAPNYEAGSQFAAIIHRQVAAERRAAGEPEAAPLPATMPAHLRHGPGSQTAVAFYR